MKIRNLFYTSAMFALILGMQLSAGEYSSYGEQDKRHSSSLHDHSSSHLRDVHFYAFEGHSMIISGLREDNKEEKTVAINPATKKPYVFWFVDNSHRKHGRGTFESPFNTLADAQESAHKHDIIYVLTGNGTDDKMNAGIILKKGQQLLGGGILQHVLTTRGEVVIPAQSEGLPIISNTFVTAPIGKSAVTLNAGYNVISGLYLVDNFGGGTGGADISAGIYIQNGLNYLIKDNILSTFSEHFGGNCLNIYGGGNVIVLNNTFIGRDTGDTFGVNLLPFVNPIQGFFVFKNGLYTGADASSGLDRGIDLEPQFGKGTIGKLTFTIEDNIFDSQTNTTENDDHAGIEFLCRTESPVTLTITRNNIVTPAGIATPPGFTTAGIIIVNFGPGELTAHLHENVSLTTPPTLGYIFSNRTGNPDLFHLDMGFDNFGSSKGP